MTDLSSLARAARPGLFETVHDPDLMNVLILANLMTPGLWEMREKILARSLDRPAAAGETKAHHLVSDALYYVDRHFSHLLPVDVAEMIGVIDLDHERKWLGDQTVDTAIANIEQSFDIWRALDNLPERLDASSYIQEGHFPNYCYMSLEGLRAQRQVFAGRRHKPSGVSICADEAALIIALLHALGVMSLQRYAILGAAAHYHVLFFETDDLTFWSNGKREYFDRTTWRDRVARDHGGDAQIAFDNRSPTVDRIITPRGVAVLPTQQNTLPGSEMSRILSACKRFFGTELRQLAPFEAANENVENEPDPWGALDRLDSAMDARAVIEGLAAEHPGSVFERAFYCVRDIHVARPEAFVAAALHGPHLSRAAETVSTFDEALDLVLAIPGLRPLRDDPNHLSLPDEVLLFKTANPRGRALLLFSLLLASEKLASAARKDAQLLISQDQAQVVWKGRAYDFSSSTWTKPCASPILHVFGHLAAFG